MILYIPQYRMGTIKDKGSEVVAQNTELLFFETISKLLNARSKNEIFETS